MVGGKHDQNVIGSGEKSGGDDRRGRIAAFGLDHHGSDRDARGSHRAIDCIDMHGPGDDEGGRQI